MKPISTVLLKLVDQLWEANYHENDLILQMFFQWDMELVFKNFKSNIEIDVMRGTDKNRIQSLVYGRLITIVTIFIIHNYAAYIANDKEVSGDKLTKYLKSDNRLRNAIIKDKFPILLMVLEDEILLICKQKRKRKSTFEHVASILHEEETKKGDSQHDLEKVFKENLSEKAA